MLDWRVKQTICGLDELCDHHQAGVTHLLSIIDPEIPAPAWAPDAPPARLVLRFHDIIAPTPEQAMPTREDVARLLAFGRTLPNGDPAHLLVHCHMGISRSTAAATAILVQAHEGLDEDEALARIHAVRGKAWPNLLMMRFADELLGRDGRLVAALGRFYRRKLEATPGIKDFLLGNGREAEYRLAEAAVD